MQGNSLHIQAVQEVAAYVAQQIMCSGHQIGYAVRHVLVYTEVRVSTHIHQFVLPPFGLLPVCHRRYAVLLGCQNLHILQVGEASLVAVHSSQFVPRYAVAVGIAYCGTGAVAWLHNRKRCDGVGHCNAFALRLFFAGGGSGHYRWMAHSHHSECAHDGATQSQINSFLQSSHLVSGTKLCIYAVKLKFV